MSTIPPRWKFTEDSTDEEALQRAALEGHIANWWEAFLEQRENIKAVFRRELDWDVAEFMHETLGCVDPNLMWEFGPAIEKSGHRLVITPESTRYLRPLTDQVLAKAPDLPDWEFYPYRLVEDLETAAASVEGRTGGDLDGVRVRVSLGLGNRVDLIFYSPRYFSEEVFGEVFVAAESLLGEEVLDVWIGELTAAPDTQMEEDEGGILAPIEELHIHVNEAIQEIVKSLPHAPLRALADDATWTAWELKPEEADDYAGQDDAFTSRSMVPEAWEAFRLPGCFDSRRFSREGEVFCYVKRSHNGQHVTEAYEAFRQMEDALDSELRSAHVGCVVGASTGLMYSYADLALTNLGHGIDVCRAVLRNLDCPLNTWILFMDSSLGSEWIGAYPGSPPPFLGLDE